MKRGTYFNTVIPVVGSIKRKLHENLATSNFLVFNKQIKKNFDMTYNELKESSLFLLKESFIKFSHFAEI